MTLPHDYFGGIVAERYDEASARMYAPEVLVPALDVLEELAEGRPALELAIGTGRVALPLRERGVDVHGIELSEAMVAQLRAKPGGDAVPVTIGDMSRTRVDGGFGLVYLVFNTIVNLLTQDAQVDCFANAADHLVEGGVFVVEVGVPDLQRLPRGQSLLAQGHTDDYVGVDEIDVVTQRMWSHHHHVDGDRHRRNSVPFRYVWPSELDLMARLAGLRLRDRWAAFDRSPFTATSDSHVSVWEKALGGGRES